MKRWMVATAALSVVVLVMVTGVAAVAATTADPEFSITGDGTVSVAWSLGAGAVALTFVGVGGFLFSRMSNRVKPSPPTGQDRDL